MSDLNKLEALDARLATLTTHLADARRELALLRASMGASTAAAAAAESGATRTPPTPGATGSLGAAGATGVPRTPPPHSTGGPRMRAPSPPPRPAIDAEKLIGRYGVLALAVVMIVMGAGALVSWALAHGFIGPWVRVTLGLVLAAALAAGGAVIRHKSNRWFGDALIAVGLAVVHVVAWGMGPALHLVPSTVALIVADVASAALMAFALRESIEALFSFGLLGALVAPFVTSTGEARYLALAAYGLVVIAAGLRLGTQRPWRSVAVLLAAGTAWYSLAIGSAPSGALLVERDLVAGFAGIVTLLAIVFEGPPLKPLVAGVGVTAMTFGLMAADSRQRMTGLELLGSAPDVPVLAAAAATLAVWVALRLPQPRHRLLWGWFAFVLPLSALIATHAFAYWDSRDHPWRLASDLTNAAIVLVWAAGYWILSRRQVGDTRAALRVAAGIVSASAVALGTMHLTGVMVPALAVHGVLFGWLARRGGEPRLLLASAVSLGAGFAIRVNTLVWFTSYDAPAFFTLASFECATVVAAAYLAVRLGAPEQLVIRGASRTRQQLARGIALLLAFAWGRAELGHLISFDIATFAVIIYYAAVGIALIWRGRALGAPLLRHAGLALAIWAALTALGRASDVDHIVWRVGSYLGVGAFLLGVAWWYRVESAPAQSTSGE